MWGARFLLIPCTYTPSIFEQHKPHVGLQLTYNANFFVTMTIIYWLQRAEPVVTNSLLKYNYRSEKKYPYIVKGSLE